MLERLRTAALQVPERRRLRAAGQSRLFTLSPLMHSNAHSGCAALLRIWPGLPLSPSPIFISPLLSSFVSISFFDKLKEQQKGEKREAFIQRLGRHKGSGVPSIGVALTWLNSSSGVSLVMSLILKTSHAPFTTSHTKLNTKSKTQTLGRKSVRKKKARERIPIRGKGCVEKLPRCPISPARRQPQFLGARSPRKRKKNSHAEDQKPNIYHQPAKEPATAVQVLHLQLSCLESPKTTEWGKGTLTPESDQPDTKPTTAAKTIPKIPINGYKPCMYSGELAIENSTRPTGGLKRGSPLLKPWSDHPLYHRCEPFNHSRKKMTIDLQIAIIEKIKKIKQKIENVLTYHVMLLFCRFLFK